MASAERLLNEAQYAFNSVGPGGNRDDRRRASRARSLARKIIRKYPDSTEAAVARSLLRRLGDEAIQPKTGTSRFDDTVSLDWGGLLSLLLATPKIVLGIMLAIGLILFSLFGWLLLLPLVALIFFTSPARAFFGRKQRDGINEFVIRANAWIDQKIQHGKGFS
ncbi:MAG: hypothetical protein QNJ23_09305 [Woeseiaceae bacterium]|nr:hypothetical protein [Woeseiaceae bacterium]